MIRFRAGIIKKDVIKVLSPKACCRVYLLRSPGLGLPSSGQSKRKGAKKKKMCWNASWEENVSMSNVIVCKIRNCGVYKAKVRD